MEKCEEIPKNWKIFSDAKNGIRLILMPIEGGLEEDGKKEVCWETERLIREEKLPNLSDYADSQLKDGGFYKYG
ncbi:hypothetical protein MSSIT_2733 [Methanosarcina siciliae T4/M]|uniref:Uncharacterized protein n=1 Tax=Methanosarcina siciliae T4/M TaxID=1434120 RepID=A0A0E3P6L4_9EURY|nr:hypothetical protein [Methanosarcina siciliae]AKB29452.1 hypothetical protein MSSIT_2733 [Methanosarcina siciliae T4/M]